MDLTVSGGAGATGRSRSQRADVGGRDGLQGAAWAQTCAGWRDWPGRGHSGHRGPEAGHLWPPAGVGGGRGCKGGGGGAGQGPVTPPHAVDLSFHPKATGSDRPFKTEPRPPSPPSPRRRSSPPARAAGVSRVLSAVDRWSVLSSQPSGAKARSVATAGCRGGNAPAVPDSGLPRGTPERGVGKGSLSEPAPAIWAPLT